jgi:hypothetical protein
MENGACFASLIRGGKPDLPISEQSVKGLMKDAGLNVTLLHKYGFIYI